MKTPCALIFPCTYPHHVNLSLISLVFSSAGILLPVEDLTVPDVKNGCLQPFNLNAYVPSPLGDDLPEFNKTLSTWEAWATQIGLGEGGISALSLLQAAQKGDESTVQTILGSLKKEVQVDSSKEARLFLALAHNLDRHEDELSLELEMVDRAQDKIQVLLKDPILEQSGTAKVNVSSMLVKEPVNIPPRLKFWSRLYKEYHEDECRVLLGIGFQTQDILENSYEVATGDSVEEIMSIPLALECEDMCARREAILPHLLDIFNAIESDMSVKEVAQLCQTLLKIWYEKSGQSVLANGYVGPRLVLKCFKDIDFQELFNLEKKLSRTKDGSANFCFFLV